MMGFMYYFLPNLDKKILQGEEGAHFWSTRVQTGQILDVCDQAGGYGQVEVIDVEKKSKTIKIKLINKEKLLKRNRGKVLFQAIPDKQYLDRLVELLPIGDIDRVVLFQSDFSPKYNINLERLTRILIRSTEQCQRLWRPEIQVVDTKLLEPVLVECMPIVMDSDGEEGEIIETSSVVIGPEGGWSKKEQQKFGNLGLKIIKKGHLVLPAWVAGYTFLT